MLNQVFIQVNSRGVGDAKLSLHELQELILAIKLKHESKVLNREEFQALRDAIEDGATLRQMTFTVEPDLPEPVRAVKLPLRMVGAKVAGASASFARQTENR